MLVTIIMDVKYEDQPIIRRNGEDELEVKSLQLWANLQIGKCVRAVQPAL
jgi:hypothetical protein